MSGDTCCAARNLSKTWVVQSTKSTAYLRQATGVRSVSVILLDPVVDSLQWISGSCPRAPGSGSLLPGRASRAAGGLAKPAIRRDCEKQVALRRRITGSRQRARRAAREQQAG